MTKKMVKVTKQGSGKSFTKIPFNYDRLSDSNNTSVNLGKPPHFDGTGYSWKYSMRVYLIGLNPTLWKIMCLGVNIPEEDEPITHDQEFEI
jgi:hypothetical protein